MVKGKWEGNESERLFTLTLLVLKGFDGLVLLLIGHLGLEQYLPSCYADKSGCQSTSRINLNLAFADKSGYCLSHLFAKMLTNEGKKDFLCVTNCRTAADISLPLSKF